MPSRVASVGCDAHGGAREVVAGEEQRVAGEAGGGVGETVSEVEIRRMAAASVAQPGVGGGPEVGIRERDDGDITLEEEAADEAARIAIQPSRQDNRGLDEGGRADGDVAGLGCNGGDE